MRTALRLHSSALASALFATLASAQVQIGTPPFVSFSGNPDVLNLANLNVHLTIPVISGLGQGRNYEHHLTFDSSVWYPVEVDGMKKWQRINNWGWASDGVFDSPTVPRISAANPVNFADSAPGPDGSDTTTSVTVTYAPYIVQTNFGCPISDYPATIHSLVDRLILPNGTFYQFRYERTPGFQASITGRISSVTFPSGGTVSYEYSGGGPGVNGISCADGSAASLTRTTGEGSWKYEQRKGTATESTTTVTDPQGNQTLVHFNGIYETARDIYQGSMAPANLRKSVHTCYSSALVPPCTKDPVRLPIVFRSISTTLPSGQMTRHTEMFDTTYGLLTQIEEYDYSFPQYSPLLKRAKIEYATSPELIKTGIVDWPRIVTIVDGSLATKSVSEYYCEQSDLAAPTDPTPEGDAVSGRRNNSMTLNYSFVMNKKPNELLDLPRPTIWDFLGRLINDHTTANAKPTTTGCTHFSLPLR